MQRLKTRPQFQAVLAGVVVSKTVHFVLHRTELIAQNPEASSVVINGQLPGLFKFTDTWIGAMAPKRWAKRAVTRNAIKRQIYTVSSDLASQLPPAAFVVRLRRGFTRPEFLSASSDALKQAVRAEVEALLQAGMRTP